MGGGGATFKSALTSASCSSRTADGRWIDAAVARGIAPEDSVLVTGATDSFGATREHPVEMSNASAVIPARVRFDP
jgi:hypothetical protein